MRQLALRQKGFIILTNSLVDLAFTSYELIVFNCIFIIYLLSCFCVFSFFKRFWAFSFDPIFDTLLTSLFLGILFIHADK